MDHPDPTADRIAGRHERDRLTVQHDLALVSFVKAVDDVHQRRLAGAVLPQEGVDLTAPDVEIDVVVREHAWEPLRDPANFEDGPVVHRGDSKPIRRRRARRPAFSGTKHSLDYVFGTLILPLMICFLSVLILAM
jgi:hypothetical protein